MRSLAEFANCGFFRRHTALTALKHLSWYSGRFGSTKEGDSCVRAWQQLADAGMIDGSFVGMAGAGGAEQGVVGINIPASQITGAGYTLYWLGNGVFASTDYFTGNNYGHVLLFGGNNGSSVAGGSVLTPSEAMVIDAKIDDGLPGSGAVTSPTNLNTFLYCATSAVQATAAYNVSYTGLACRLMFALGF